MQSGKIVVAGAMVLGLVGLGGCATKKYVNAQVATVSTRVDANDAKLTQDDAQLASLDQTTREALQRAEAAHKLAEGKFVYSTVLQDDSMKFRIANADLSPEAQARLDTFIDKLKTDNRNVYVEIQGHTDATGPKDFNYHLGEARAEAVRRYLNEHGVALNRLATISYGPDVPVAPNSTREGRQANRRVLLIVMA